MTDRMRRAIWVSVGFQFLVVFILGAIETTMVAHAPAALQPLYPYAAYGSAAPVGAALAVGMAVAGYLFTVYLAVRNWRRPTATIAVENVIVRHYCGSMVASALAFVVMWVLASFILTGPFF